MTNSESLKHRRAKEWERIKHNREISNKVFCPDSCNKCGYDKNAIMMGGRLQCRCQAPFGTHTMVYIKRIINNL